MGKTQKLRVLSIRIPLFFFFLLHVSRRFLSARSLVHTYTRRLHVRTRIRCRRYLNAINGRRINKTKLETGELLFISYFHIRFRRQSRCRVRTVCMMYTTVYAPARKQSAAVFRVSRHINHCSSYPPHIRACMQSTFGEISTGEI